MKSMYITSYIVCMLAIIPHAIIDGLEIKSILVMLAILVAFATLLTATLGKWLHKKNL